MSETKENVSENRGLEQEQLNEGAVMKEQKLVELNNANIGQQSIQIKNEVPNGLEYHKDSHRPVKPRARGRKNDKQTPTRLSDSGSSLTSLTSSSDEFEIEYGIGNVKQIKNEQNDSNEGLKNSSSAIEERDNIITTLRAEIASLQEGKEATEKELQDTRQELTNSLSSYKNSEDLQENIKEWKSRTDNQMQEISELKDQLEAAKKGIEKEHKEVGQLTEELASAKSKAKDQAQEISELKEQLEMGKKEIEDKEKEEIEMGQLREELESAKSKADAQDQEIGALKDQLEMSRKEIESTGKDGSEVEMQLREELVNAKTTIRSINQANSKLEAKLSNSQTLVETGEVERQKLKEETKALKDKIKWLERRRAEEKEASPKATPRSEASTKEELDRKLHQESQRRTAERIRELEQKVIHVNEEKQKLQHDYDEAVKALEAVDKVYSVREMALQQYKSDLEDANNSLKQQSSQIQQLKMENDQLKKECEKAEKKKSEQEEMKEELREELTRTKETVSVYKTEIDEVRKELSDQIHEIQMAQAKARERGKKIQILELELKETKETLQISENVINEKTKNMESLQESLQNEKKNCKKLEQELEEMFYLKKKLELIEDEKTRVVEKLRGAESDLKETREALHDANKKIKDLDKEMESLRNDHKTLSEKCEDQDYQIQTLRDVVDSKEGDIEQQLIEIIHSKEQLDDVTLQLQDIWASYKADKTLWKHSSQGRSVRRRPHSTSARKVPKAPTYQTPPQSKTHSLYHRRLVNKLGEPVINQNYISSSHKSLPASDAHQTTQEGKAEVDGSPENKTPVEEGRTTPMLSPRPPDGTKPRPVSSYGIRTYPPSGVARNGEVNGYHRDTKGEDVWMYKDGGSSNGDDSDEQIVQLLVNAGDRVLIQSKVVGDELLNVSGVVKFVGKVGKKVNSPVYVGLKLDQPFGDNNGVVGGKQIFKCQPRHGKLIKMSDIQAVMHPRTQNYQRVKSFTANW